MKHRSDQPRSRLSRSTWRRVQRSLTAGLFVAATAAGVTIGLGGATVSPVAPAPLVVAMPVAPLGAPPAGPHVHGHHR